MTEKKLIGVLSGESVLRGRLSIPQQTGGDPYGGSYDVIPSNLFQMLPTADCILEDDVVVHPVSFHKVSNPSGGYTVTIGE